MYRLLGVSHSPQSRDFDHVLGQIPSLPKHYKVGVELTDSELERAKKDYAIALFAGGVDKAIESLKSGVFNPEEHHYRFFAGVVFKALEHGHNVEALDSELLRKTSFDQNTMARYGAKKVNPIEMSDLGRTIHMVKNIINRKVEFNVFGSGHALQVQHAGGLVELTDWKDFTSVGVILHQQQMDQINSVLTQTEERKKKMFLSLSGLLQKHPDKFQLLPV